jgi:hypothetical protein
MLTNINSNKDELLQLILDGPARAARDDHAPELRQFAQRVTASFHISAHGPRDHARYIRHRLQHAGRFGRGIHRRGHRSHLGHTRAASRGWSTSWPISPWSTPSPRTRRVDEEVIDEVLATTTSFSRCVRSGRRRPNEGRDQVLLAADPAPPALMMAIIILFTALAWCRRRLPAIYEAEARLLVESPQISDDLVNVTVTTSADEEITIIRERLLTRANLLEIADEFDVFENYSELTPDQIVERMQETPPRSTAAAAGQATLIAVASRPATADRRRRGQRIRHPDHRGQRGAAAPGAPKARSNSSSRRCSGCRRARPAQRPDQPVPGRERRRPARRPEFRLSRQAVLQERLASAQRELSSLIDQRARIIEIYEATGQIAAADQS